MGSYTADMSEVVANLRWFRSFWSSIHPGDSGEAVGTALRFAEELAAHGTLTEGLEDKFASVSSLNTLAKACIRSPGVMVPFLEKHGSVLDEVGAEQLARTTRPEHSTRTFFELWTAAQVSCIDQPRPGDPEPDVQFQFGGQTVGFACKFVQSRSDRKLLARVGEAARQIETGPTDFGFPLIGLTARVDHSVYAKGNWASRGSAATALETELNSMLVRAGVEKLARKGRYYGKEERKKILASLFVVQSCAPVGGDWVLLTAGRWVDCLDGGLGMSPQRQPLSKFLEPLGLRLLFAGNNPPFQRDFSDLGLGGRALCGPGASRPGALHVFKQAWRVGTKQLESVKAI